MTHPYQQFVSDFVHLQESARRMPLGALPPAPVPRLTDNAPRVLLFAPHPDDESLVGGLALRLRREMRYRVTVVAVTQGSRVDRQAARLQEMLGACHFLGFELISTPPDGLTGINPRSRSAHPGAWAEAVGIIREILVYHRPSIVLLPHQDDSNTTHIGTHLLVVDALRSLGPKFQCRIVETEFWRPMAEPNLMIESSPADVGDLVAAISFHQGEVGRNPYHLLLPSWMSDNVRRGSELVGTQGGAAAAFPFATLYRVRAWDHGDFQTCLKTGVIIPAAGSLETLFG